MKNLHSRNGFTLTEVILAIMLLGIMGTALFIMQSSMIQQVQKIEAAMDRAIKIHNTYIQYLFKQVFKDEKQTDAVKEYPGFSTETQENENFEGLEFLKISTPTASGKSIDFYYPVLQSEEKEKDGKK
jgi:prepilin-type N-terminal cleavage/methylation domain-containing protein